MPRVVGSIGRHTVGVQYGPGRRCSTYEEALNQVRGFMAVGESQGLGEIGKIRHWPNDNINTVPVEVPYREE